MRVVRCKLVVHPTQVQHRIDLPDQVISRNHLVEIKCVEKPALSIPLAPHHALPPSMAEPFERNHDSHPVSIGVLQHIRGISGSKHPQPRTSALCQKATSTALSTRPERLHSCVGMFESEGDPSTSLKARYELVAHQCAGRPHASLALNVA